MYPVVDFRPPRCCEARNIEAENSLQDVVFQYFSMPNKGSEDKMPWWQPGLILFARLSGWIGGPILIAIFIGKWLDKKYHSEPWLFLLSVGIAFVFSTYGIVRDSLREMKRIDKEEQDKKKNS